MSEDQNARLSDEQARRLIKTIEEVEKEEFDALEATKESDEEQGPTESEAA